MPRSGSKRSFDGYMASMFETYGFDAKSTADAKSSMSDLALQIISRLAVEVRGLLMTSGRKTLQYEDVELLAKTFVPRGVTCIMEDGNARREMTALQFLSYVMQFAEKGEGEMEATPRFNNLKIMSQRFGLQLTGSLVLQQLKSQVQVRVGSGTAVAITALVEFLLANVIQASVEVMGIESRHQVTVNRDWINFVLSNSSDWQNMLGNM